MKEKIIKSKVLVVDDESQIVFLLKQVLEREGYEVFTASNGIEGIDSNSKNNPDVIILDLKMPAMNGIEALEHIRKTDEDVKVIILTGYGNEEMVGKAESLNAYKFINKPFNIAEIRNTVRDALKKK